MNMNSKEIQNRIQKRIAAKSDEELIKEDEDVLMANYLSEIQRLQKKMGFTRKDLAAKINTSASYLTQVFRGDKPLNFYTLAKIQRALAIRFHVSILPKKMHASGTISKKSAPKTNTVKPKEAKTPGPISPVSSKISKLKTTRQVRKRITKSVV
jgi:ribosome-binding protein aMBF1 (putative translation factor)